MTRKESKRGPIILGAGITGLAAGYVSGVPIYEARATAGGICTSYYMRKGSTKRLFSPPKDGEAYHFETGGGHWIFGGDPVVHRFKRMFSTFKKYERKASIYLPDQKRFVPYPIQNNLFALDKAIAKRALHEMTGPSTKKKKVVTMAHWLEMSFGKTLCKLFFHPFHELYTAGLWSSIAPQDSYKSPIHKQDVLNGFSGTAASVGYNTTFLYPERGLDFFIRALERHCDVRYGKRVVKIDTKKKEVLFSDTSIVPYTELISTLPLNKVAAMAGIKGAGLAHPSPSVLVINIGAKKGLHCPTDHWTYIPKSKSGFHRVGFYSNVDTMFLPKSRQKKGEHVSIYVEKAYPEHTTLTEKQMEKVCQEVLRELQEWKWIEEVDVYDPTWIEVAYTWSWPNSKWREHTLRELEKHGIYKIGRYGRWIFQGIADSVKDGLMIGAAFSAKK